MKSSDLIRKGASSPIQAIETKLIEMLSRARREVDLAMSVLLSDLAPKAANKELRATDQKINEAERDIRRRLIVHASVFGSIEIPSVLLYMSIVKDIERVGDYAKNLIDLALDGVTLEHAPDLPDWKAMATEISTFIAHSAETFHERDKDRAIALLTQGNRLLDDFNRQVSALVKGTDYDPNPVARALALRYLKRVVAHLLNMLSAVVLPLDRLDYFYEPGD
jgi:hypothetical protein